MISKTPHNKNTLGAFYFNKAYNIAYKRIPKSACTTLENWLAQHHDNYINKPGYRVHSKEARDNYFDKVSADQSVLPTDCFTFSFVRDPYRRFLSFYNDKILTDKPEQHIFDNLQEFGIYPNVDIEECAQRLSEVDDMSLLNPHVAPQHLFIFSGKKQIVDYIGRLESFSDHAKYVQSHIGSTIDFKDRNVSTKKSASLNDKCKSLIAESYAKDFTLLDYPI